MEFSEYREVDVEATLLREIGWSQSRADQERRRFKQLGFLTFPDYLRSIIRLLDDVKRSQFQNRSHYPRLSRSQGGPNRKIVAIAIGERRGIISVSEIPTVGKLFVLLNSSLVFWIHGENVPNSTNRWYRAYDCLEQTLDIPEYGRGIPVFLLQPIDP